MGLVVVGSENRTRPGWDGATRPFLGISSPDMTVVSVAPDLVDAVEAHGSDIDHVFSELPEILSRPQSSVFTGVLRWSESPTPGPDRGVWVPTDDPIVLPWLRPFNGDVLVGLVDGAIAAGVGRKQHDEHGHELAVVTEEAHRGQGWARDLVAQAARRVLDDGAIATYLHAPSNHASARTADAAGFPDRGWRIHSVPSSPT